LIFAVTGAIGAGKTTLAARLAAQYGAVHLSSDNVRLSLSHNRQRSGARVFAEFHRRFERAVEEGRDVVLDSTGMSPRFRALLRAHRRNIVQVHLLLASEEQFKQREEHRVDRPEGPLPVAAFRRSQHVRFHDPPDLVLATDGRTPEEVFSEVLRFVLY
jgi:predicted kinase